MQGEGGVGSLEQQLQLLAQQCSSAKVTGTTGFTCTRLLHTVKTFTASSQPIHAYKDLHPPMLFSNNALLF
jgi:predicted component of type VI protein secretion system